MISLLFPFDVLKDERQIKYTFNKIIIMKFESNTPFDNYPAMVFGTFEN
jgi:hypothetical protein